jgi:NAD-dependent SIR2 family protein deacetylase
MSKVSLLKSAGLLNVYAEDVSELQGNLKRVSRAFCTSRPCGGGTMARRVPKPNVNTRVTNCPDCGHVLFWKAVWVGQ